MKLLISIILISAFHLKGYSQFGPQQIISGSVPGNSSVMTADLDGDGDEDVISHSIQGQIIVWFENLDGYGTFSDEIVIFESSEEYVDAIAVSDIDGDGDIDVLSSTDDNIQWKLSWHENLDGQGSFSPQHIISSDVFTAFVVIGVDIDNDLDTDILITQRNENRIAWLENLDGLGNFGPKITISTELDWPNAFVGDIDNDGDIDILASSAMGNKIGWLENLNGMGAFSGFQLISTAVSNPSKVFLADINMDSNLDAISTSLNDNKIAWYENIDGQGNFGPQEIITTDVVYPGTLFSKDLDNDGDVDIVSSYWENFNGGIIWLENTDGMGTFSLPKLISDEVEQPTSVFVADLDNDQDFDVLSSSFHDYKIAWYENLTILAIPENRESDVSIFPNPVDDILHINTNEELESVNIINQIGVLIRSDNNNKSIITDNLQSGIYFIQLYFQDGHSEYYKIIKD